MVQEQETMEQVLATEGNPPQPGAEAATPSAPAAPPQPDFARENAQLKEELARERTEREKEIQARRSAEGRLNAADRKRIITAEKMAARALSEEDRAAAQKEAEEASAADEYANTEIGAGRVVLSEFAMDMGKNFETDAAFAEVRDLYAKGYYLTAVSRMKALHKSDEQTKRVASQATAEAAEVRRQATREGLETRSPRPAAASLTVTPDNIDLLYSQGKVSDTQYRRFLATNEI
mgnify:CR=1 FL=1